MIQFNLLPDVKLEYIRAQRTKHVVVVLSAFVGAGALTLFVLMFMVVRVLQQEHIRNLNKDIASTSNKLQQMPSIDKILTVQNQLQGLPDLHAKKPAATRFYDFIAQLTPAEAGLSAATINFTDQSLTLSGGARTLADVNKFVDTLKFTKYVVGDNQDKEGGEPAFSEVVLASFGREEDRASFQITLKFDPTVFDNTQAVTLVTPPIVSTRSQTEKPSDPFKDIQTNTNKQP